MYSHIQQIYTDYVIPVRGIRVQWLRVWIPKPVCGYESPHLLVAM